MKRSMKNTILVAVALAGAIMLIGCGKRTETVTKIVEVPVPTTPADPTFEEEVLELVALKNEYRLAAGQVPLTRGLTCQVFPANGAGGDLDVSFGSAEFTYTHLGNFNQPNATSAETDNFLPSGIREAKKGLNYQLRCQGQIVIVESGYYTFTLDSDDGSRLWVNGGSAIIDNEGNHAMTLKSGTKLLERGIYSFRLDYAQSGGGNHGLILSHDGSPVPAEVFYR